MQETLTRQDIYFIFWTGLQSAEVPISSAWAGAGGAGDERPLHRQPALQSIQTGDLAMNEWMNDAPAHPCIFTSVVELNAVKTSLKHRGAGIAQWLEHRTRDWKVTGSNPCWNGGRIFFSRVDFLCWLLFRYPFHPRVTTVARKKSRSFCQKCRWQVTAKHAYTLRMWILLNRASALVTTCP